MTAAAQEYRRDLNLNLTASFRPGSRVSAGRLEKIQTAVENALATAMNEEMPNATADLHSKMNWVYVYKETEFDMTVGDDETEIVAEDDVKLQDNDE